MSCRIRRRVGDVLGSTTEPLVVSGLYVCEANDRGHVFVIISHMANRGPQELGNIMPVLKEFFSARTFKEFGDFVSCYLPRLFSGQGSLFSPFKDGKLDPARSIRSGLCESEDVNRLYLEHFYRLDPFVIQPFTPYPDKVYTTEDIIKDEESFLKSEYYNDFLRRFTSRSHIFINLGNTEQRIAQIIITGDSKRKLFGSADRSLARLIEPSLTAALQKVFLLNQKLQDESIIDSLLERVQARGVAELDDSFQPVRTNRNWDAMISTFYQEHEVRKGLPEVIQSRLKSRMSDILSGHEITFAIKPPSGDQRLLLSVEQPTPATESHRFLVLMSFERPYAFASQQMRRYRLTEREIEITALICEGLENGEIADRLCISEYTVVNHIRHIFEKSNVRSRIELFQRVLELTLGSS